LSPEKVFPCLNGLPSSQQTALHQPLFSFGGRIILVEHLNLLTPALHVLLNNNAASFYKPTNPLTLGMDLEWLPSTQSGAPQNPTALLQLCNGNTAVLVRLLKTQ